MTSKKKLVYNIIAFFLLFYTFNLTIISAKTNGIIIIIFNYAFPIIAFGLLLLDYILKKNRITKYRLIILILTAICCFLLLYRNGNIIHRSNLSLVLYNFFSILLPFFLCSNKKLVETFIKIIPIFLIEHIIGVFIEFLFPQIYLNLFINGFFSGAPMYIRNYMITTFNQGFLAGFTSHYSSTGIYLSIAIIFFFYKYYTSKDKKKKNLILLFFSIMALMMTGKRAVFVFSLFSCLFMMFFLNNNLQKMIRFIIISVAIILTLGLTSKYIPAVNNTITRFTQGDIDSNFGNRKQLYEYATSYYKQSPLIGNGWSTFKYSFASNVSNYDNSGMQYDCHNIYLQILCETGIIGFLIIIPLMLIIFIKTIFLLKNKTIISNEKYYKLLVFSSIFQLFFLLYGLTGNPLYDIHCYLIYYIAVSITILCIFKSKTIEGEMKI